MPGPTFNPAMGGVVMDLGHGPVVIDEAFGTAIQDFIERAHDALLRADEPDRIQARILRRVSFDLIEAEVANRQDQERSQKLATIPQLKPLCCKVVKLRPELWGAL